MHSPTDFRQRIFASWRGLRDLTQQVGQCRIVAIATGCELDSADVGRRGGHGPLNLLAPLAPTLNAVLACLPFAIVDPGAGHKQVQRAIRVAKRDLVGQRLLPAAQCGEIRHGPVWSRQLQRARHDARGLAKRWLEQDLDREAELYGRIGKHHKPSWSPVMRRTPGHVLVDPDQQVWGASASYGSIAPLPLGWQNRSSIDRRVFCVFAPSSAHIVDL